MSVPWNILGINDGICICMLPTGFSNFERHVGGEDYMLLLLSVTFITTITGLA